MKRISILIGLTIITLAGFTQVVHFQEYHIDIFEQLLNPVPGAGKVQIRQDEKLTEVLFNHIEQNKRERGIPMYWIRIYSDSGHGAREKAYSIKSRFLKNYENILSDVVYDDPNYKVYVGGYHTKSEALRLLRKIHKDFPTAFIVYDHIIFPELHIKKQLIIY